MMRAATALVALTMLASSAASAAPGAAPAVLVVGVPHFDNPGRDVANAKVEDVLTPRRQREIDVLVARLAAYRPNHVLVEWPATKQAALDQRYADYRAGRYSSSHDEIDQLGLRLAARLGLQRVDAVDWNEDFPGKDEDYDFVAWLKAHGRYADFTEMQKSTQRTLDGYTARNRCRPVADWVREINGPAFRKADAASYFRIAGFGDAANNPGAAWVGGWYGRNLRIVANIQRVSGGPGDRSVAIFGAGHAPLLERYAAGSGFVVADLRTVLPPPSKPSC